MYIGNAIKKVVQVKNGKKIATKLLVGALCATLFGGVFESEMVSASSTETTAVEDTSKSQTLKFTSEFENLIRYSYLVSHGKKLTGSITAKKLEDLYILTNQNYETGDVVKVKLNNEDFNDDLKKLITVAPIRNVEIVGNIGVTEFTAVMSSENIDNFSLRDNTEISDINPFFKGKLVIDNQIIPKIFNLLTFFNCPNANGSIEEYKKYVVASHNCMSIPCEPSFIGTKFEKTLGKIPVKLSALANKVFVKSIFEASNYKITGKDCVDDLIISQEAIKGLSNAQVIKVLKELANYEFPTGTMTIRLDEISEQTNLYDLISKGVVTKKSTNFFGIDYGEVSLKDTFEYDQMNSLDGYKIVIVAGGGCEVNLASLCLDRIQLLNLAQDLINEYMKEGEHTKKNLAAFILALGLNEDTAYIDADIYEEGENMEIINEIQESNSKYMLNIFLGLDATIDKDGNFICNIDGKKVSISYAICDLDDIEWEYVDEYKNHKNSPYFCDISDTSRDYEPYDSVFWKGELRLPDMRINLAE